MRLHIIMKSSWSHYRYTVEHMRETTTSNDFCVIFLPDESSKLYKNFTLQILVNPRGGLNMQGICMFKIASKYG